VHRLEKNGLSFEVIQLANDWRRFAARSRRSTPENSEFNDAVILG